MKSLVAWFTAATVLLLALPARGSAQTVISNLGTPSYGISIDGTHEAAAIFLSGPAATHLTQLQFRIQQGGFGTVTGTFMIALYLADPTSHAPVGAVLAADTPGFSTVGQTQYQLAFDATVMSNLTSYTLQASTAYALVLSQASDANFNGETAPGGYATSLGFTTFPTLASSDAGVTWGGYAGTNLLYAMDVATVVPEPSTAVLWSGVAALGLVVGWRRRRRV